MSFLGGIFTGSNPTLDNSINTSTGISGFGTAVGEGDIKAASGFDEALLSGDQSKEAKLLAPQISNIQKQGQQQIQTAAEFGNRSGGTNAAAQTNIDSQRANVNDMIAKLTGGAASDLGHLGESTLGLGLSADQLAAQQAEQKQKEQQSSLLGGAITGIAGAGLDYLTGGIAGGFGGGGGGVGSPGYASPDGYS